MADKRELILARIMEVVAGITGMKTTARNRGLLSNEARPAVVLMDGDESAKTSAAKRGRGSAMAPAIMNMRPEIYVVLDEQRPKNETVGTRINDFRLEVAKRIAEDATLVTLTGSNGGIDYRGMITDLKSGSAASGQCRLDFVFTYVFDPTPPSPTTGVS